MPSKWYEKLALMALQIEEKPQWSGAIGWSPYVQPAAWLDWEVTVEFAASGDMTVNALNEILGWPGRLAQGRVRSLVHRGVLVELGEPDRISAINWERTMMSGEQAAARPPARNAKVYAINGERTRKERKNA